MPSKAKTTSSKAKAASPKPPVMELLKLAEVEHQPKNNRMRAL
jgi:hypothetical protein